jgi:hypothetical protein
LPRLTFRLNHERLCLAEKQTSKDTNTPGVDGQWFCFKESPEYEELRAYELDISGVVVAAFAKYLCRLHERKQAGEENEDLDDRKNKAGSGLRFCDSVVSAILTIIS